MLQLVNSEGQTIGVADKIDAHREGGSLHRAVSVLLLDEAGRMLIQRRSDAKYHFAGKWANACCTHPLVGESIEDAGSRALREELGVEATLTEVLQFTYEAHDPTSGLTEQEYDHVLTAVWSGEVRPNPNEVSTTEWVSSGDLVLRLIADPEQFAFWFRQILKELACHCRGSMKCPPALARFAGELQDAFDLSALGVT
ncbi:MAG: isopentenyl-diphosphate Delta-isomerase [Fimbriimonas sp.]|nr:isopentenyl-diphosphate Delta-isomerase [Fimbriimonas sp.]